MILFLQVPVQWQAGGAGPIMLMYPHNSQSSLVITDFSRTVNTGLFNLIISPKIVGISDILMFEIDRQGRNDLFEINFEILEILVPSENIRKTIKYTAGTVCIIIIQALAVHFYISSLLLSTYLRCGFIPSLQLFINFIRPSQIHWT